jgi:hypothetical protein
MKKLGFKDVRAGLLKRLGLPESEPITPEARLPGSDSEAIDEVDGLPPELADYPGLRKLFAQAQKQQVESAEHGASPESPRPDDKTSAEGANAPSRGTGDQSTDALPNAAVEQAMQQAKQSAVLSPIDQHIASDASLGEPAADLEPLQEVEQKHEPSVEIKGDKWRPALDTVVSGKPHKRTARPLLSRVFDWIVLLLLCVGLAFAITALATLFKTTHAPH